MLAVVVAVAPAAAIASTTAYVGGGLLSGTVEACLKDMKTAADKMDLQNRKKQF